MIGLTPSNIACLLICLGVGHLCVPTFATPVRLGTQINDTAFDASGLPLVECVFDALNQPLHIQDMPWRRAQQDVKREVLDGFFMAIPDAEAERYASLSAPLMLENWYWFSLPQTIAAPLLEERRTGVILGSHQERWFWEKQITPALVARDLTQLIKLLFTGRVEGVIADKDSFEHAARRMGVARDDYQFEFMTYMPLSVYFGEHYLRQHTDFLPAFNQQIPQCVKTPFLLSAHERKTIRERIDFLQDWMQDTTLQQAVAQYNHIHSPWSQDVILQHDLQWQQAVSAGDEAVLAAMVDYVLLTKLHDWRARYDFVNEIIVTDVRGLNVAATPWSSDYWQGDEEKFIAAIAADFGQWKFGEVVYDRSTSRFQVSVSVPVYMPGHVYPQGVLILGIDIHRILQKIP